MVPRLARVLLLGGMSDAMKPTPPIACQMGALSLDQRARQRELLESVRQRIQTTEELADGFALTFNPDAATFRDVAEWGSLERRCCPFLDFTMTWSTDDVIRVTLRGSEGAKEVFASAMKLGARS